MYVLVTHYRRTGRKTLSHAWGPFDTREEAIALGGKFMRQNRARLEGGSVSYHVLLVIDPTEEPSL